MVEARNIFNVFYFNYGQQMCFNLSLLDGVFIFLFPQFGKKKKHTTTITQLLNTLCNNTQGVLTSMFLKRKTLSEATTI